MWRAGSCREAGSVLLTCGKKLMSSIVSAGEPVLIDEEGSLGILTLNRPQKLNALNEEMCSIVGKTIQKWDRSDHPVRCMIIKGRGKAFCSGGDVKHIVQRALEGDVDASRRFFRSNYRVDYAIARLKKPCIVVMDGVTYGGGCGLSMHARYRIGTEWTDWAMPETQIGYFPDCGSSFVMYRPTSNGNAWGLLYALTGMSVPRHRLKRYGLVTHYIRSSDWSEVEKRMREDPVGIDDVLKGHEAELVKDGEKDVMDVLSSACEDAVDVEDIVDRLRRIADGETLDVRQELGTAVIAEAAFEVVSSLQRASPLALKITFELARLSRKDDSLKTCMEREWMLTHNFTRLDSDFVEGVRTKLDKSQSAQPRWLYTALAKTQVAVIIKRAADTVVGNEGVVTRIAYYGDNALAKAVKSGNQRFTNAQMFSLRFFVKTTAVTDIEYDLRVDEHVMRWVIEKQLAVPKLPYMKYVYKEHPELKRRK